MHPIWFSSLILLLAAPALAQEQALMTSYPDRLFDGACINCHYEMGGSVMVFDACTTTSVDVVIMPPITAAELLSFRFLTDDKVSPPLFPVPPNDYERTVQSAQATLGWSAFERNAALLQYEVPKTLHEIQTHDYMRPHLRQIRFAVE